MASPSIHTYHCLCNTLLLATTHPLNSLPRRAAPSLDSAIIIPLPPAPKRAASSLSPDADDQDEERNEDAVTKASNTVPRPTAPEMPELGYTLLLSTNLDRRPTIIRRSDGFEKRYLLRCARCRLVLGYELDEAHFAATEAAASTDMDVDGEQGAESKEKRMKCVYLLPGGIMGTKAMAEGKKIAEQDVLLQEDNRATFAAWES